MRRKSDVLMEEALKDLEVGCYNKAVSAAYFSVRAAVEHLLPGLRTSKDDKIANALKRVLRRELGDEGAEEARGKFLALFEARKVADHRPKSMEEEEARFYVSLAVDLRKMILKLTSRP